MLTLRGFPGGAVVKNLPVNAGDTGLIPRLGRSPGEGNSNLLQYSCLENSMDRSLEGCSPWVWSWTRLSEYTATLTLRSFPGGLVAGSPQGCGCGRGQETKTSADRTAEPVCSGARALQPEEPVCPQLEKACAAKANKQINNTQ